MGGPPIAFPNGSNDQLEDLAYSTRPFCQGAENNSSLVDSPAPGVCEPSMLHLSHEPETSPGYSPFSSSFGLPHPWEQTSPHHLLSQMINSDSSQGGYGPPFHSPYGQYYQGLASSSSNNPYSHNTVNPSMFSSDVSLPEEEDILSDFPGAADLPPSESTDSKDLPYARLIWVCLKEAPNHTLTLREIYDWFREHTRKCSNSSKGWQNSIRHNLSMNKVRTVSL